MYFKKLYHEIEASSKQWYGKPWPLLEFNARLLAIEQRMLFFIKVSFYE